MQHLACGDVHKAVPVAVVGVRDTSADIGDGHDGLVVSAEYVRPLRLAVEIELAPAVALVDGDVIPHVGDASAALQVTRPDCHVARGCQMVRATPGAAAIVRLTGGQVHREKLRLRVRIDTGDGGVLVGENGHCAAAPVVCFEQELLAHVPAVAGRGRGIAVSGVHLKRDACR